jgi:hypothetical protein
MDVAGAGLVGLIGRMDAGQAVRLRQAVVGQALAHIEWTPEGWADWAEMAPYLAAARAWLADPTPYHAEVAAQVALVRSFDNAYVLMDEQGALLTAEAAGAATVEAACTCAVNAALAVSCLPSAALRNALAVEVRAWQQATAGAILAGADPPPVVPVERARLEAATEDAVAAYQGGNLEALVGLMTAAQALRFQQAVVEQAIRSAEPVLPPESGDRGERACLAAARAWVADPSVATADAARAACFAVQRAFAPFCAAHNAADAAAGILVKVTADRAYRATYAATLAVSAAGWAAAQGEWTAARQQASQAARAWQVGVAWAVLQDED